MKDRYGYLIMSLILALILLPLILFACTSPIESGRMPGEYVLGEDGNGPIDVFFAGMFDNLKLYRMQDIETGASCYILGVDNLINKPAISCISDPLTPRG